MSMGQTQLVFACGYGGMGRERGTFAFQVVFGVKSGLFTFHLDIQLSIQVFFFFLFFLWDGRRVKAKSSQVPNMFLKEFPIVSHFYPISFGKCCPPFIHVGGPKGENSIVQNKTFYLESLPSFFCFCFFFFWGGVIVQSNWLIAKIKIKINVELGRHLI
jgi:hypothetical protein